MVLGEKWKKSWRLQWLVAVQWATVHKQVCSTCGINMSGRDHNDSKADEHWLAEGERPAHSTLGSFYVLAFGF